MIKAVASYFFLFLLFDLFVCLFCLDVCMGMDMGMGMFFVVFFVFCRRVISKPYIQGRGDKEKRGKGERTKRTKRMRESGQSERG